MFLKAKRYELPGGGAAVAAVCDHKGLLHFRVEKGEVKISDSHLVDFLADRSIVLSRGLKKRQLRVVRHDGARQEVVYDGAEYARRGTVVARQQHGQLYTLPKGKGSVTVADIDWAGLVKVRVQVVDAEGLNGIHHFLGRQLGRPANSLKILNLANGEVLYKGEAYGRNNSVQAVV